MPSNVVALPIGSPVADPVDLGRQAWGQYLEAQDVGFSHLMLVGAALLIGRRRVLRQLGLNLPRGFPYQKAFSAWIDANGFRGMDPAWRVALLWCAEHVDQVEAARAQWRKTNTYGEPSVHPISMRAAAQKFHSKGPAGPRGKPASGAAYHSASKAGAPLRIEAVRIEALCERLLHRFQGLPDGEILAEIASLVSVLEAVAKQVAPKG